MASDPPPDRTSSDDPGRSPTEADRVEVEFTEGKLGLRTGYLPHKPRDPRSTLALTYVVIHASPEVVRRRPTGDVTLVHPEGQADVKGVKLGWKIVAINGAYFGLRLTKRYE